ILQAANGALAEKMDELAKLAARLDAAESHPSGLASGRGADAASQPLRRRSSLAAAVTRAVDSLRPELPRDLELDVALQEEGTSIPCDAFQIEQMVLQLLRNAATAAGAGGRVGVTLRAAGEAAEIEIEDDGPGIDQEVVDRIFDPFEASQVAGAEQGFGLPVSYRIVQGHGGELRIESEPDRGTRVTAILPLR
ncbi:MAG: ATP-binding protein, partial [Proteobacteria bacterium]|nr:ATP-binding protein [Pseudomonadota bacterium]